MNRFANSTAIVTGAGSGLGRATALRLASEGSRLACFDLVQKTAERTTAEITVSGGTACGYAVDVADPGSVGSAVEAVARDLGRPSVLVNCAGTGKFAHSHEMPFEEWSRIIAVNLTGTFLVCQAVIPHMLDVGGSIVNIASNAGLMGQAYSAAYCSSKGGVIQLTRALAEEYLKRKIRVNAIAPGFMETPFGEAFQIPEDGDPKKLAKIVTPLGTSSPDEVAALVAFVASNDGRYMTGSIVSIDGGLTI